MTVWLVQLVLWGLGVNYKEDPKVVQRHQGEPKESPRDAKDIQKVPKDTQHVRHKRPTEKLKMVKTTQTRQGKAMAGA